LASVPGVAWATDCRRYGRRCTGDRQCCSRRCIRDPSGEGRICGCPTGQTRCGDRCVNLQRSERHCGSCGNRCADGAECVNGMCQGEVLCPDLRPVCSEGLSPPPAAQRGSSAWPR
jgi:Stigma-specific protein, Stig1